MMMQAAIYVLETIFHLFVLAVLTRFYAQALRAPFRNPIADFVVALTNFAVKPMRKIIPGVLGLDLASLLVAWAAEILLLVIIYAMVSAQAFVNPGFWPTILMLALVKLIKLSLYLLLGVVLIQALLSWFNPFHPIRSFFEALSRPFLRPLQRVIPPVGGVDLAPLVLLIVLQVILMAPIAWLENEVGTIILRLFAN